MPSFDGLEPLAPDACRADPTALCYYWHLKLRALDGGSLSGRDLELVGVGVTPPAERGWYQPAGVSILAPLDEMDTERTKLDTAIFQALIMVGSRERLEFLGG